jgi:AcrR family transcriptional regulator
MGKARAKRVHRPRTYTISLAHRKARGSGHERMIEIMEAARQLFVERGVENVTTREIAARVGISQTALFTYYKTKDEILSRLMVDAFEEFAKTLAAVGNDAADPSDWLRRMIAGYVQFGLTRPDEYRLAFMLVKGPGHFDAAQGAGQPGIVQQVAFPIFIQFEQKIAEAMRSGIIRDGAGSSMLLAQSLWAAMHGLTSLLIARPRPHFPWEDRDRLIAAQADMILNGILSRATSA